MSFHCRIIVLSISIFVIGNGYGYGKSHIWSVGTPNACTCEHKHTGRHIYTHMLEDTYVWPMNGEVLLRDFLRNYLGKWMIHTCVLQHLRAYTYAYVYIYLYLSLWIIWLVHLVKVQTISFMAYMRHIPDSWYIYI